MAIKINLGASNRPLKGYTNHDAVPGRNIDLTFDLNGSWALSDNSVERYVANNVLQYLNSPVHFFQEVQRTLKPLGTVTIQVPHAWTTRAVTDPGTKQVFLPEFFRHFTYEGTNSQLPRHFVLVKAETSLNSSLGRLKRFFWKLIVTKTPLVTCDVFDTIKVVMRKVSPQQYELAKLEEEDT